MSAVDLSRPIEDRANRSGDRDQRAGAEAVPSVAMSPFLADGRLIWVVSGVTAGVRASDLVIALSAKNVRRPVASELCLPIHLGLLNSVVYLDKALLGHAALHVLVPGMLHPATVSAEELRRLLQAELISLP